jgi:hypothetical protein
MRSCAAASSNSVKGLPPEPSESAERWPSAPPTCSVTASVKNHRGISGRGSALSLSPLGL